LFIDRGLEQVMVSIVIASGANDASLIAVPGSEFVRDQVLSDFKQVSRDILDFGNPAASIRKSQEDVLGNLFCIGEMEATPTGPSQDAGLISSDKSR
jgi:hypothetical protein